MTVIAKKLLLSVNQPITLSLSAFLVHFLYFLLSLFKSFNQSSDTHLKTFFLYKFCHFFLSLIPIFRLVFLSLPLTFYLHIYCLSSFLSFFSLFIFH